MPEKRSGGLTAVPAVSSADWNPDEYARYVASKRILDVVLTLLLMPFVLTLLAGCAIAIKIDSRGPVFFRQRRTGRWGRSFTMYKLRTMYVGSDKMKEDLAHLNVLSYPDFKIPEDPRITRVGAFLRKSSLDELPQFFNVLLGDMSLVGPRPTSFGPETYRLWHTARLDAKPGITGLWQISGRSDVEFDERLRMDITYIRRRSLGYDLWILLRTIGAVVGGKGAS